MTARIVLVKLQYLPCVCWHTPLLVPQPGQASPWTLPGSPLAPRGPGWTPPPGKFPWRSGGAPADTEARGVKRTRRAQMYIKLSVFYHSRRREKRRLPEPCRCGRSDPLTWLRSRDVETWKVCLHQSYLYYLKHELSLWELNVSNKQNKSRFLRLLTVDQFEILQKVTKPQFGFLPPAVPTINYRWRQINQDSLTNNNKHSKQNHP